MSESETLIRRARDLVGWKTEESDWRVAPTEHAASFPAEAGPLVEILLRSRVQGLADAYERRDAEAVRARDRFKKGIRRANRAVFAAASMGALLLVANGMRPLLDGWISEASGDWLVRIVAGLGALAGLVASAQLGWVKAGDFAQRWMRARAKAEAKRLAYFKSVMQAASEDAFERLLVLEYVRRFLLDNQLAYFRERGVQHERASDRALASSTVAALAGSAITMGAGALALLLPDLAAIAGLGLVATAYGTMLASMTEVDQDRKNADRYRIADDQLTDRRLELDDYRARVAGGDLGAVQEFFQPIFVALEADHRGFLEDGEHREAAIGAIEARLESPTEGGEAAGPADPGDPFS